MITYLIRFVITWREANIIENKNNVLEASTLSTQLYKKLREQIIRGDFAPGEQISIRQIANLYGVSTMPVREALNKLEFGGFVTFGRRSILVNPLSTKNLIEIFEIRKNLEKMALEWAYPNITQRTLSELEDILKVMDTKIALPLEWNQLNKNFHFKLYSCSGTEMLMDLLDQLWGRVGVYMNIYSISRQDLISSQKEHYQLLKYIANKEFEKILELSMNHIEITRDAILAKMES